MLLRQVAPDSETPRVDVAAGREQRATHECIGRPQHKPRRASVLVHVSGAHPKLESGIQRPRSILWIRATLYLV